MARKPRHIKRRRRGFRRRATGTDERGQTKTRSTAIHTLIQQRLIGFVDGCFTDNFILARGFGGAIRPTP
jgi:hypothetical protein